MSKLRILLAVAVMLGASAAKCWCTRLSTEGAVNGGCPASISYSTQPSE